MESEVFQASRMRPGELRWTPAPAEQDAKCRTFRGQLLLAALVSAGLLWLAYFPAACGWLGWVALVPLLCLVRTEASTRRVGLYALLAGLLFYWPALQWMRLADERMYATWALVATHCALFFLVGFLLLRRLDRCTRLPLVVTLPVVWTATEFTRANLFGGFATLWLGNGQHDLPGGFPWYFLGHTQHAFLPIIQIADLGGAYGVTFLVAAVNALVFELLATRSWFRTFFALRPAVCSVRLQVLAVALLFGSTLGYGLFRLSQEHFAPGPRVALLQGNLDQSVRNASGENGDAAQQMFDHFNALADEAAQQQPRPDLIVWPETSYVDDWVHVAPELASDEVPENWKKALEARRDLANQAARRWKSNLLIGLNTLVLGPDEGMRKYNSALLIAVDPVAGGYEGHAAGRYDKVHRIPFGEYVPFRDSLPWLKRFAPYDFDYSIQPGEALSRFELRAPDLSRPYSFGVIICYEDTDPYFARQYGRAGADPVDFLVNISNDGWFQGSSEHEEHLAVCRFRAIECRRAIARAVNMGISAVIDGSGRVVALPGPTWSKSKKFASVLTAVIPIDGRASLYALWGDWLPWTCGGILMLALIVSFVRRPVRATVAG